MAGLKVFLSHVTVEAKFADWLQHRIEEDFIGLIEVSSSSDRVSVPVGHPWFDSIMHHLEQSSMHLVLCSPESILRPWIHFEAGAAFLRRLPLASLCHSGLIPAQLPVPLSVEQGIQLSEAKGLEALYLALAGILGSAVPRVRFEEYAEEVQRLETEYVTQRKATQGLGGAATDDTIIRDPRVLCITSQQFLALGFENQIELVLQAFPQRLEHHRLTTSAAVRDLLAQQRIDVVHVAAYVCPRTGDVYFSDVDLASGRGTSPERDVIQAEDLAELLALSHTQLLVIGSCESLALAVTVLPVVNVVATRDMVSPMMMAKWVEVFYGALVSGEPLSTAYERAVMASGASMWRYARNEMRMDLPADALAGQEPALGRFRAAPSDP